MDSSCPVGSPCSRTTNEGSDSPAGRIPATLRPTRRLPPSRETPPQPRASSPRSRGSTAAASASTASARAAGSSRRPPRVGDVVSWALIESGPTVTQGESDAFANFAASLPIAEAERAAHAQGPSGYDPAPSIRKLAIPVLWLYAGRDRAQPNGDEHGNPAHAVSRPRLHHRAVRGRAASALRRERISAEPLLKGDRVAAAARTGLVATL